MGGDRHEKMHKVLVAMMVVVMMATVVFTTAAFAETEARQEQEEVEIFDADGKCDGTTSGGNRFLWRKIFMLW